MFDQGQYGRAMAIATVPFATVMLAGLGIPHRRAGPDERPTTLARLAAYACAGCVTLLCLYPYLRMLLGACRSTETILSSPALAG